MLNLGWDTEALLESGNLELMYRSPVEMQLDEVAAELFGRVRDAKIRRVAIDALGDLERSSVDRQRFADFIYALTQWFAVENVTCMMTTELPELFGIRTITEDQISNMSDNLILLGFTDKAGELERTVRIMKTRGSSHDHHQHTLDISAQGLVIKKAK
jgi:circadian clock protein KaiC